MDGLKSLSRPFLLLNVLLSYVDDVVHATGDNIDLWLPSICTVIGQWTLDIPGPQIATNKAARLATTTTMNTKKEILEKEKAGELKEFLP